MENEDQTITWWNQIGTLTACMVPFQILIPMFIFPMTGYDSFMNCCFSTGLILNGFILYRVCQKKKISKKKYNLYRTISFLSPIIVFVFGMLFFMTLTTIS